MFVPDMYTMLTVGRLSVKKQQSQCFTYIELYGYDKPCSVYKYIINYCECVW